jgi:hypothetical protein
MVRGGWLGLLPLPAGRGGEGAVKLQAVFSSLVWRLGRVLCASASSFCCLVPAPWWRRCRLRKFDRRLARVKGSFPPAVSDDFSVPRPDFKGVGHPLPLLQQAVQAILSPLFPKWLGSPVAEWWLVCSDLVGDLPESSRPCLRSSAHRRSFLHFYRAVL